MVRFCDPAYQCFTFNSEDMTPTIEDVLPCFTLAMRNSTRYILVNEIRKAAVQIVQLSDEAEALSWQFFLSQRSSMSEFLRRVKKQGDVAREFVTHLRARDIDVELNESDTIEDVSMIHPCPPGYVLNNWTAVELLVVFKSSPECSDIHSMNNPVTSPEIDFEKVVCLGEFEAEEDAENCDLPHDLLRMVEQ
ncbi:hypothetical protein GOBAR_DD12654 [Gossypium barbadense]|nr:hypothetical protein GOBAR_DD12654 [Gossypium barbadense]